MRRVRRGSISSELYGEKYGGCVRSMLLLRLVARCLDTVGVCMYMAHFCFKLTLDMCMVSVCCVDFASINVVINLISAICSALYFNFERLWVRSPVWRKSSVGHQNNPSNDVNT